MSVLFGRPVSLIGLMALGESLSETLEKSPMHTTFDYQQLNFIYQIN